ncbi:hypothetical protein [Novipirellula caenicola]|uniref:hypothetical protein n=1 Tax=Novipirellula caenicola TaxID=1536901 RepID=UPI0031EFB453
MTWSGLRNYTRFDDQMGNTPTAWKAERQCSGAEIRRRGGNECEVTFGRQIDVAFS